MIYVDTSVLLAQLFAEDRIPAADLWAEPLVTSRLLEYELWNRLNARGLAGSHGDAARLLLGRLAFLELTPEVLARALDPYPNPVRTLDALHLASVMFLVERGHKPALATFDTRMAAAARAMSLELFEV